MTETYRVGEMVKVRGLDAKVFAVRGDRVELDVRMSYGPMRASFKLDGIDDRDIERTESIPR